MPRGDFFYFFSVRHADGEQVCLSSLHFLLLSHFVSSPARRLRVVNALIKQALLRSNGRINDELV